MPVATRVCRFYDGTELTEKVVEYTEGERMNVEFVEFSMPLKRANVVFEVREVDADHTEVSVSMDYDMKLGPLGWLIDVIVLKPTMRKVFVRMLEGLSHHARTGELIGPDGPVLQPA